MNTFEKDRERRLATILAADIAGYSRLMDVDEEGTYTALHLARSEVIDPEIEKHRGHIVKHMGDGFLAEFPTVMSAIHFAMAMQEDMRSQVEGIPKDRQIKFRIGINLGDIMVDETGDIFGDGVNIAARLESLGIPGGICISGPVYESVLRKLDVDFDDLGYQSIKNISTPVHAYDIRWPGEAGAPDERAIKPMAKPKPMGLIATAAVAVAGLMGIVFWQMGPAERSGSEVTPNSVAVLPFINMSSDPEQEYFSDGITEEILDDLAKLPGLKVSARTSAFSFKNKNVPIPEIAQILGVAHVLEGSVRRDGNRVRITAQLIEARSDTHVWSETYDRELADIFAVQDEIAGQIAEALQLALGVGRHTSSGTTSLDAYELVLRGRFYWAQRTLPSILQAIEEFEAATALDPNYVNAWIGLANSEIVIGPRLTDSLQVYEHMSRAELAARQALELDPNSSQAHAVLGLATQTKLGSRDIQSFFRDAIELDPNNATAYHWLGVQLGLETRFAEAEASFERAIELDPRSAIIVGDYSRALSMAGEYQRAIEVADQIPGFAPDFVAFWMRQGWNYLLLGDVENAVIHMRRYEELVGRDPDLIEEWIRRTMTGADTSDLALPEDRHNKFLSLVFARRVDDAVRHAEEMIALGHAQGGPDMLLVPWVKNVIGDHPKYRELMRQAGWAHLLDMD